MNEVWNLDPIYKGFDDPAFAADMEKLSEKAQAVSAFAAGMISSKEKDQMAFFSYPPHDRRT